MQHCSSVADTQGEQMDQYFAIDFKSPNAETCLTLFESVCVHITAVSHTCVSTWNRKVQLSYFHKSN